METLRTTDLLLDAFGRIPPLLTEAVRGLDRPALLWRPDVAGVRGNSIGWIAWHLARQEDAQIAGLADGDQVWRTGGWHGRTGVPYDEGAMGYGMDERDVARFDVTSAEALIDYYAAVHARTVEVVDALDDAGLARIIDRSWDPPVTVAVRLVSIVDDAAQHVGQAAYLRGLLAG
jgi:DinB family protein